MENSQDCPIHKIRLETLRGNYRTQEFVEVEPFCPLCKRGDNLN